MPKPKDAFVMTSRAIIWVVASALALVVEGRVRGEVRVLVVGGGPDVYHNEVFFERNVGFFRETMRRVGQGEAEETLLFAGGGEVGKTVDVSYKDARESAPAVNRVLAKVFEGNSDVDVRYRRHRIKGVDGGATKKDLVGWFEKEGKKLRDGDVLFVYVTAHGGGSGNAMEVGKSTIALWPNDEISVGEFTGLLDKLPEGVKIVTVMVQCYCGGFGEIVFKAGLPPGRVSEQVRVGFFATLGQLTATGCTPDVQEETYADYSTHFFAALGGVDRVGREVAKEKVDLDKDGKVSMAEAHGWALLAASTDIPTTTSEIYLRRVSKVDGATALKGVTYEEVKLRAGAVRLGVLEALGRELGLAGWKAKPATTRVVASTTRATTRAVRGARRRGGGPSPRPSPGVPGEGEVRAKPQAAERVEAAPATGPVGDWIVAAFGVMGEAEGEKKELEEREKKVGEKWHGARNKIRGALVEKWPELQVGWHPGVVELLKDGGKEVMGVIEGHAAYGEFERSYKEWEGVRGEIEKAEVRRTRAQRFLRTAATVALEGRLSELKEEEREVYGRLVREEGRGLGND